MANATQRSDIIKLVVMATGGAPGTTLLGELVVAFDGGKTLTQIAADLTASDSFRATYPIFATPEEFSTEFLTNILPGVSATIVADVVPIAVGILNSGGTRADILVAASQFLASLPTTDAVLGTQAALFQNQVTVATYHTVTLERDSGLDTALAGVTADAASVTTANATLDAVVPPTAQGQTFTLTTSATDTPVGTANNDTFIGQLGQSTTLQSSDTINGGSGMDTLRVVTDGTTAQSATGFTTTSVETLEVQAQATGGSTLSLENVTGVTTIRSASSSGALTLNQVKAIAALDVQGALNAAALTVNYQAAAVAGTADVQALSSNGNVLGALTVNGVETLAITTTNANSSIASVTGDKFTTVTAAGDKSVSITGALPNTVKTVDASAQTAGGISFTAGTATVTATGGAGSDTANFTGSFTSADSFNGGEGRDTIVANQAEYTGSSYAAAAKISNVETIRIADALTANFDAGKIAGEDTYRLDSGFTGPVTISDAPDASTLNVRAASTGTLTYTIGKAATLATVTGTANTLNVAVGGANGVNAGTISSAGVETMTLASNGSSTTTGGNTLTLAAVDATKLTVTGSEDLTLTLSGTHLINLDASASSGENDFSAVTYQASKAATIAGGSGIDKINGSGAGDTISGGAGADIIAGNGGGDTITGGEGADTFTYNLLTDSQGTSQDTITDFVTGTDKFNFAQLAQATGRTTVTLKNGSAADFGTAQAAIALNSGVTQVVFQADTNTLWVDLNDDGTLNNNDLSIKLTGITKLAAADVGGTATPGGTGNFITLSAAAATVNATTSTNANAFTTTFNDTISSTIAQLVGSTVDGLAGTDILRVTDAGTVAPPATITNVETLQLATVGTTANIGVTFLDAQAFTNVTGSANADTIASTAQLIESGKISLGAGNDTITSLDLFETAAAADTSTKFDIDMGEGDDTVTTAGGAAVVTWSADSKIDGGAGNDTLNLVAASNITAAGSITGFETVNLATGTTTMTLAQYNSFTNVAATAVAGNIVVLTTAGALTTTSGGANVGVETYTLANGTNTITTGGVATTAQTITGGTGVDTLNTTIANGVNHTFAAGTGADVLNITGGMTAAASVSTAAASGTVLSASALETINISGASTANALTLVSTVAGDMTTINASGVTGGGISITTTGLTASGARTITLTDGNDTITNLTGVAGAANNLTVDFGKGVTDTVSDYAVAAGGLLTLKLAAQAGSTKSVNIAATTADLGTGSSGAGGTVIDFDTDVAAIALRAIGTAGTNVANQVFISNAGGNSTITLDVNGDGVFGTGDIQISVVGQALTGAGAAISGGNLQL